MRSRSIYLPLLVCAAALGACGPTPTEPGASTPPPTPGSSTTTGAATGGPVAIMRSGGIAGVMQQLTIGPDGSWVYIDRRAGTTQRGRLTDAQSRELARLISDPALILEARSTKGPWACSDAYIYSISFGAESIVYEQCGVPPKRPVTDAMLNLVIDATPL